VAVVAGCICLFFVCYVIFDFDDSGLSGVDWSRNRRIFLAISKAQCEHAVETLVPLVIPWTLLCILLSLSSRLLEKKTRPIFEGTQIIARGLISLTCTGVMAIPLLSLTPHLADKGFVGFSIFSSMWNRSRPYFIANGYGLFRRMTGVGNGQSSNRWGWSGLPPSIVERPEITLEGIFEGGNVTNQEQEWTELDFRWKPGNIMKLPGWNVPYQPRLDWQMWFAALGHYSHNPWLLSFMDKLLEGCNPVIELLDEPSLMFKENRHLVKIRARLWLYDFTRLDTEWNRRIPGVVIVNKNASFWHGMVRLPEQVWFRRGEREYLPPFGKDDPYVSRFLSHYNLVQSGTDGIVKKCVVGNNRCSNLNLTEKGRLLCNFTESVRETNMIYAPFMTVLMFVLLKRKRQIIGSAGNGLKIKED